MLGPQRPLSVSRHSGASPSGPCGRLHPCWGWSQRAVGASCRAVSRPWPTRRCPAVGSMPVPCLECLPPRLLFSDLKSTCVSTCFPVKQGGQAWGCSVTQLLLLHVIIPGGGGGQVKKDDSGWRWALWRWALCRPANGGLWGGAACVLRLSDEQLPPPQNLRPGTGSCPDLVWQLGCRV